MINRETLKRWLKKGKSSNYAQHYIDAIRPSDSIMLVERVSYKTQAGELDDQDADLKAAVQRNGAKVIGRLREIMPATDPRWWKLLRQTARYAKAHGAKL